MLLVLSLLAPCKVSPIAVLWWPQGGSSRVQPCFPANVGPSLLSLLQNSQGGG